MTEQGNTEVENESAHVLILGDKKFECADELSLGWILRHAGEDYVEYLHNFLVKVVDPDDLNDVWDALDELDSADAIEAINDLVQTYSGEPQGKPQRSASGSKRTKRK